MVPIARFLNSSPLFLILIIVALLAWIAGVIFFLRARSMSKPSDLMRRAREMNRYHAAIGVFAALIFIGIGAALFVRAIAVAVVSPQLAASISEVDVDGRRVEQPAQLIGDLRGLRSVTGHHSHPSGTRHLVSLSTSLGPLSIVLAQDSDDAHEYWAYYSGLGREVEIGHVFTEVLDQG